VSEPSSNFVIKHMSRTTVAVPHVLELLHVHVFAAGERLRLLRREELPLLYEERVEVGRVGETGYSGLLTAF
jgi:hypothetical protein